MAVTPDKILNCCQNPIMGHQEATGTSILVVHTTVLKLSYCPHEHFGTSCSTPGLPRRPSRSACLSSVATLIISVKKNLWDVLSFMWGHKLQLHLCVNLICCCKSYYRLLTQQIFFQTRSKLLTNIAEVFLLVCFSSSLPFFIFLGLFTFSSSGRGVPFLPVGLKVDCLCQLVQRLTNAKDPCWPVLLREWMFVVF